MRVVTGKAGHQIYIGEVVSGTVFEHKGIQYLKLNLGYKAANLGNGRVDEIAPETHVTPKKNAVVFVEGER